MTENTNQKSNEIAIKLGTGGFRSIIGEHFNKQTVQLLAQALSNIAVFEKNDNQAIVVGYDRRFLSDQFALWICEVFAGNNIKTLLYPTPVPTPAVMYAVKELATSYGIMITASHNHYYYNGVKVFLKKGIDADVFFTTKLEEETKKVNVIKTIDVLLAKQTGLIADFDFIDNYLANIKTFIDPKIINNNAKVLFDNMYGVGVVGLQKLAFDLNIKQFDIINANHDAFFNFTMPNPTAEGLSILREKVISVPYDYGLATDSDGDRLGVVDNLGNYVSSNDILGVIYYYLVKYRGLKGDIVKNCATSILIDKLADKFRFTCHEVDVGFKNISAKMLTTDSLIGGESSGGLTVRGYILGKDSIFSSALFMEMQSIINKPVANIIEEMHHFAEYNFHWQESEIALRTTNILDKISSLRFIFADDLLNIKQNDQNIKYYFKNGGWALLRLSGTEPLLRIFVEMDSISSADYIMTAFKQAISKINNVGG